MMFRNDLEVQSIQLLTGICDLMYILDMASSKLKTYLKFKWMQWDSNP